MTSVPPERVPFDPALLDPQWRRAFATVEQLVGGRVVAARRQARWRPAWFLDVEQDGRRVPVYFRGDRGQGQGGGGALEREMGVLQVLERHDIPVPHVFGFCEEPRGIVMEQVRGRANLATAADESQREAVLDHYMDLLVAMHGIDAAEFEKVGVTRPDHARDAALVDLPRWESGYRQGKCAPEPLIELCVRWLHRNVPDDRDARGFVTGDAGQFLFEGDRVTAVIDLELATIGDPLADLGALRSRDISEPLGDLSRAYRRYERLTGLPIDMRALHFHSIRFALNTPLAVAPLCQRPAPGLDFAQYLGWKLVYGRLALEIIALVEGVALTEPELRDAHQPTRAVPHQALLSMLETQRDASYEADAAYRIAQYLRELDGRGAQLEAQDLDEAGELLGRRPASWAEADAQLESLVLTKTPAREPELIRYLYRRTLREESLLSPAMRELRNARFQTIRIGS